MSDFNLFKGLLTWDEANIVFDYDENDETWQDYHNPGFKNFIERKKCDSFGKFNVKQQLTWDQSNFSFDLEGEELIWNDYFNWWFKRIIYRNMERYLHNTDYWLIQDVQLGQLIQKSQNKLIRAENLAMEEIYSYLVQRFDLDYEFTDTSSWSPSLTYSAHDRVIMDYPLYSTYMTYSISDCVIYNGDAYIQTATSSISGTWSSSDWTNIGPQYGVYYASYPVQLFDYLDHYEVDEVVYWKGYTYSCVTNTHMLTATDRNQYLNTAAIPLYNVFPDDDIRNNENQYWVRGGTYSIPMGTLPTDANYWTAGDNRSQQVIMYMIDIVLFHLHKSISPNNIPQLRVDAYKMACNWLDKLGMGDISTNVLKLQPRRGNSIRYGGNTKNPNNY